MAYNRVPEGQVVGLKGPRGSRRRPSAYQGVKGWATRSKGVKGLAFRVPGGRLQGPRWSRGTPSGSHGVQDVVLQGLWGSRSGPGESQGVKR